MSFCFVLRYNIKVKGKDHPITGYEGPRGGVKVELYSFSTSALGGGAWSAPRPGRFTPGKDPGTHCTGGWVGPRAGLDVCEKSHPHRDTIHINL
jgi:hypothetical protein